MEDKKCPVLVDGQECGHWLTLVDFEVEKIARYDLATYQCSRDHRSYTLLEPRSKATPFDMTREQIEQKMRELTRKYAETNDPEIRQQIYRLGRELSELDH